MDVWEFMDLLIQNCIVATYIEPSIMMFEEAEYISEYKGKPKY